MTQISRNLYRLAHTMANAVTNITEVKGDLFTSTDSLVHCVSRDLHMGKGIATMFKSKFGGVEELRRQNIQIGGVGVLERDGRFIYYMVTKEKYFQKPTLGTVRSSLTAVKEHCLEKNVVHLAMPRIGCGLDKLNWEDVSLIVKDVFDNTGISVTVYKL